LAILFKEVNNVHIMICKDPWKFKVELNLRPPDKWPSSMRWARLCCKSDTWECPVRWIGPKFASFVLVYEDFF